MHDFIILLLLLSLKALMQLNYNFDLKSFFGDPSSLARDNIYGNPMLLEILCYYFRNVSGASLKRHVKFLNPSVFYLPVDL